MEVGCQGGGGGYWFHTHSDCQVRQVATNIILIVDKSKHKKKFVSIINVAHFFGRPHNIGDNIKSIARDTTDPSPFVQVLT